jgi:hypothetical protein
MLQYSGLITVLRILETAASDRNMLPCFAAHFKTSQKKNTDGFVNNCTIILRLTDWSSLTDALRLAPSPGLACRLAGTAGVFAPSESIGSDVGGLSM